jgi:hypothetical protein
MFFWVLVVCGQTTLKKFFKFQIEEDVMRQLVEQVCEPEPGKREWNI